MPSLTYTSACRSGRLPPRLNLARDGSFLQWGCGLAAPPEILSQIYNQIWHGKKDAPALKGGESKVALNRLKKGKNVRLWRSQ